MEGLSHEAASLAGHLGLGHLIVVFDDNHITIDGNTDLAVNDDYVGRFEAYGWHTEYLGEIANDLDALEAAVRRAMAVEDRPSMLVLRSHIGYPSPEFTDDPKAHGDPFPPEEISRTKAIIGLPPDETFYAPGDLVTAYRELAAHRGAEARTEWQHRFDAWTGDRAEWEACWTGEPLPGWEDKLPTFASGEKLATRQAIQKAINATLEFLPGLLSGAGDLTGNTGTKLDGTVNQSKQHPEGRQIHFGIREHAMGASMNGMALHGGILPIGGTFFVFSDYLRPTLRLASMSRARDVFIFTHDSVGLGEDGPTHQPIEHLASVRAIPGLQVIRPADANETAAAWRIAVTHDGPTALILTRQGVPVVTDGSAVEPGAAPVLDADDPQLVLIGTGSEVSVALDAAAILTDQHQLRVRVVSMPSWDRFSAQSPSTRAAVLPPSVPTLSVEAAATFGWERWADASVGIDRFGASAPGAVALNELGINPDHVVARALELLAEEA
jgi:transketolase